MRHSKYTKILTRQFLRKKYSKEKTSSYKIAKEVKCNPLTILEYLRFYNIRIRTKREAMIEFNKKNPSTTQGKRWKMSKQARKNVSKGQTGRKLSKQHKEKIKNKLKGRKRPPLTKKWKKKISLTKGGTGVPYENSNYPEEFNGKLKEKIRYRDKYKCQLCNLTQRKHIKLRKEKLQIHHIDYNKENNKETNLICLCYKCNPKVNANRDYWTKYFRNIIFLKCKRN